METFTVKFIDQPPLEISLSIAKQGSTLRNLIEISSDGYQLTLPEIINFERNDLISFLKYYPNLIELPDIDIPVLLGIITVVDYFGFDDIKGVDVLNILITKLVRWLSTFNQNLPVPIKEKYITLSDTIKYLIRRKLQTLTFPIHLGYEKLTIGKKIYVQVVSNGRYPNYEPYVAGWIYSQKENGFLFYCSNPTTDMSKEERCPRIGILNIGHHTRYINEDRNSGGDKYSLLSYHNNTLSLDTYIKFFNTQTESIGIHHRRKFLIGKLSQNINQGYYYFKSINFKKYSEKFLSIKRLRSRSINIDIIKESAPWQLCDKDDEDFYGGELFPSEMIYVYDTLSNKEIFRLYEGDCSVILEDTGRYILLTYSSISSEPLTNFPFEYIYRIRLLLYDIEERIRCFKFEIPDDVSKGPVIELDIYNKHVRLFYNDRTYQVLDFNGKIINFNEHVGYIPGVPIKNGDLVILGQSMFNYYPNNQLKDKLNKMGDCDYGLFLRDPVTLELKEELIRVVNSKSKLPYIKYPDCMSRSTYIENSHLEDICVSPDGKSFTFVDVSTIHKFYMFTGEDEEVNEILKSLEPQD